MYLLPAPAIAGLLPEPAPVRTPPKQVYFVKAGTPRADRRTVYPGEQQRQSVHLIGGAAYVERRAEDLRAGDVIINNEIGRDALLPPRLENVIGVFPARKQPDTHVIVSMQYKVFRIFASEIRKDARYLTLIQS